MRLGETHPDAEKGLEKTEEEEEARRDEPSTLPSLSPALCLSCPL